MSDLLTMFLCGDVMTGRGIDRILPYPGNPTLHETHVASAEDYVKLAERTTGPFPRPVDFPYVWGDALDELESFAPDVRLVNLETSITRSDDYWRSKGVHYRMSPDNAPCLTAAGIDCCSLANNHVLDWGFSGLLETLETLGKVNIKFAGAGKDVAEAGLPARIDVLGKGRVLVFSLGSTTSGIPPAWAAGEDRPGVDLLQDLSEASALSVARRVQAVKQPGDVAVVSIHWGSNWGYLVPREQVRFAHALIASGAVDVVHGHSSHHVKAIEVYREKLVLYGCGDFLNDYEGIEGYEEFRGDLGLMYFASLDPSTGRLAQLQMRPTCIRHFRVNRASTAEASWLAQTLSRECAGFGTTLEPKGNNTLALRWLRRSRGSVAG